MTSDVEQACAHLRCPVTHQTLELDVKQQRLVTADGRYAYPIIEGIPVVMADHQIKVDKESV